MQLVTGGAGFIGSHLVSQLLERGEQVRVLDNLSTGSLPNLPAVRGDVEFIQGDIRDEAIVSRAVRGVNVVFHLAAIPSVPQSVADPKTSMEVNVGGTLNLLLAARDAGCERVVFASSSAVYGDNPENPKSEAMLPRPLSPYAVGKLAGEHLCANFATLYGLETVALRYFNVYGPRQDENSPYSAVIPRFLNSLLTGQRPIIYGDGEQTRDFVCVDDVVQANLLAAEIQEGVGQVFNIASGTAVSLKVLLSELTASLGKVNAPLHVAPRPGDVRHSLADISKASNYLRYYPRTGLSTGLSVLVANSSRETAPIW